MQKEVKKAVKKAVKKENKDEVKMSLKKASDDVIKKVNSLKNKLEKVDPGTRKKIIAGVSAAAAGLAIIAGVNKHMKK